MGGLDRKPSMYGGAPDVALPKTALRHQVSSLVSLTVPRKSIAGDKKIITSAVILNEDEADHNDNETDGK